MYWTIFKWKPSCVWNRNKKLSGDRILKWIILVNDILYDFFMYWIENFNYFSISLFFNIF